MGVEGELLGKSFSDSNLPQWGEHWLVGEGSYGIGMGL